MDILRLKNTILLIFSYKYLNGKGKQKKNYEYITHNIIRIIYFISKPFHARL